MSTIKKSQHYVWRNYLRAWGDNNKIWSYLRKQDKVLKTNLTNVAQSNYYYKLVDIDEIGLKFLQSVISKSPESVRGLQNDFLLTFTIPSKLKELVKKSNSKDLIEQLRKVEINSMENAHSLIESSGEKLISCRSFNDFKHLENNKSRFDANMFLCFQYFRTKNIREKIKESFKTVTALPALNIWNILSFILALNTAEFISLNVKTRYLFLENVSPIKFVTSDQPVINLQRDKINKDGDVEELEFYYPISPEFAVIIDFDNSSDKKCHVIKVNEEKVAWLNNKMINDFDNYLFSNNENQLINLRKNCP